MPTEAELLKVVIDRPYDDAPRLAYAAWCDTQPDAPTKARAEFIRVQIRLNSEPFGSQPAGPPLDEGARAMRALKQLQDVDNEEKLRAKYAAIWAAPFAGLTSQATFRRGFVSGVTMTAPAFLASGADVLAAAPIVFLTLTGAKPLLQAVCMAPHVARIRALSLRGNGLDANDMWHLAHTPNLTKLWWLGLAGNTIALSGLHSLAASRSLPALRYVDLAANPIDPRESIATDGGVISHAVLPPEGEEIERIHGRVKWLHFDPSNANSYTPDPYGVPPN